jgi:hypothetical protein
VAATLLGLIAGCEATAALSAVSASETTIKPSSDVPFVTSAQPVTIVMVHTLDLTGRPDLDRFPTERITYER